MVGKTTIDDLIAGSLNPFELFCIFNEIVDAGVEDNANASRIAYMIDQSHNIEPKIEAMIQSVINIQTAYAKALLVDRPALQKAQEASDVLGAYRVLQGAYETDVRPLLADVDAVPAFAALIDPDDPRFLAPEDMPAAINMHLLEHGQMPLQAPTAFTRCIMESLVLRYREVFHQISGLTGTMIKSVYILGGGARNGRLNQWLADALAMPVIAGQYEATALGNALMQLVGLGELHSLEEVRAIAQNTPTQVFSPRTAQLAAWHEAAQRFSAMADMRAR